MAWPKGKSRKVVGSEQRSDAVAAPVEQVWKTDVIEGADPGFAYQFMREHEVHDRSRSKYIFNRDTGQPEKISPWVVVQEGEVGVSRERPDLAAPVDSTMRMGPHVLMKIPKKDWELLQHAQDARPDAFADNLMRGVAGDPSPDPSVVKVNQQRFAAHPALMGGLQE